MKIPSNQEYRQFLSTCKCAWPGCGRQSDELHHEPPKGMGGVGKDIYYGKTVPLCRKHHQERHDRVCGTRIKMELRRQAKIVKPKQYREFMARKV